MVNMQEILKTLDVANVQIKAEKCKFEQRQIEWLGCKLTNSRVSPVNNKMQGQ